MAVWLGAGRAPSSDKMKPLKSKFTWFQADKLRTLKGGETTSTTTTTSSQNTEYKYTEKSTARAKSLKSYSQAA